MKPLSKNDIICCCCFLTFSFYAEKKKKIIKIACLPLAGKNRARAQPWGCCQGRQRGSKRSCLWIRTQGGETASQHGADKIILSAYSFYFLLLLPVYNPDKQVQTI